MLDDYLPEYDIRVRHSIEVYAPTEVVYPIARNLDLSDSRLIRALFTARGLRRRASIDDLERVGFTPLGEDPPNGFILGLVGRFWKPSGELVATDPDSFVGFDRPGFAKAVWSFELTDTETGTTLATETRVHCLDDPSRRRFRRYWRVIGPFSGLIRRRALRIIKNQAEASSN